MFAKGSSSTRAEQTISVMCEFKVKNARDVRKLSVFGSTEQEWLLLPGARFGIDSVKDRRANPALRRRRSGTG